MKTEKYIKSERDWDGRKVTVKEGTWTTTLVKLDDDRKFGWYTEKWQWKHDHKEIGFYGTNEEVHT